MDGSRNLSNLIDNQPGKIKTLAFFSSSPGGIYKIEKWNMWRGINDGALAHGFNLLYVAGEEFENSPQSILYDLIHHENVDGFIFWNAFFSPRAPKINVARFLQRYGPLPFVSIEISLPNSSSVLVDNAQGIRHLLEHLVVVHQYDRIAFITEPLNHSADSRKRAFEQIMREKGLLDPLLVGTLEELDARGMQPGKDYRALIAYADKEAMRVINEFRDRGISTPDDVAVTGFNDGYEARSVDPALTTMRLPYRRMGRVAVDLLVEQLNGKPAGRITRLPMYLILRSSCGCFEPLAEMASAGELSTPERTLKQAFTSQRAKLLASMAGSMGTPVETLASAWAKRLLNLFADEIQLCQDQTGTLLPSTNFLGELQILLRQAIGEGINIIRWNAALSQLRRFFLPYLDTKAALCLEDRCHQTRVLISQMAVRSEIARNWRSAQWGNLLRTVAADLLVVFDIAELNDVLVQGLRKLEFPDVFLVLYPDQPLALDQARLVLAYRDGQKVDVPPSSQDFPLKQILPKEFLSFDSPQSFLLEALFLGSEQIGFLAIRTEPPTDPAVSDLFDALCIEISSAIKNIQLKQKLQEAVRQAEEANLLKSRFLSMVSHELRTPLNLIVGLSEMAMRQQTKGGRKSLAVLSRYLEQVYVSGQHLDRLIRDVLDLASSQVGQMTLVEQPVNLSLVLNDAAVMGKQLADQKNLLFRQEISSEFPLVWGDKTRLRQVVLNLLSNAVKFTARGEICLSAEVTEGLITISVRDTGLGIAKEEQVLIFDEFHQSTRTMVRGYGGIGLGLAITRRLVELHGGRIWVESTGLEGSGSTFRFSLPVMDQNRIQAKSPISSREGSIFILSDTLEESQNLRDRLDTHGFDVEILGMQPVPDLIEALASSSPGALVLDLPPASEYGWELMKSLKEDPRTQDLPILFYSLVSDEGTGAVLEVDYLTKPVGVDALVKALKRYGLSREEQENRPVVLIVDDDPGILSLHSEIVMTEFPEVRVLTANNGKQGFEIMRNEQPDLVLLDLMMPEMDGFGVLRAMQEDNQLRSIPVIILTAQVLTHAVMSQLKNGVASVLAKGLFNREEISRRIESVLKRSPRIGVEVHKLVREAMAFIHEQYKESISRIDIANHLCVNEQYLSRCFNKELGIGPMAYLGRYRIEQAKRLLEDGQRSITQVALEVGFSSQSYFSRIFQQETGRTPSEYMRGAAKKA